MPNYPAITGAMVVASLAFATAVAIYESPQARQFAEDLRRKIAVALHALGDEINPQVNNTQPRFNRPEDAEGFLKSEACVGTDDEANEETKRRQREELLYWNAVKIAREKKERMLADEKSDGLNCRGSEPEDLRQGFERMNDEKTYTYNSGANVAQVAEQNLRNRCQKSSMNDANPFSDKFYLRSDSDTTTNISSTMYRDSERQDVMSNIYSATDVGVSSVVNAEDKNKTSEPGSEPEPSSPIQAQDIYASIHAWAKTAHSGSNSNASASSDHLSPALTSSRSSVTVDFESSSVDQDDDYHATRDGNLTPTYSNSVVGSAGETLWGEQSNNQSGAEAFDSFSISGESSITGTWTEVDSVISDMRSS